MAVTSYIRSLGVPCSQYIDDRHVRQLSPSAEYHSSVGDWSDLEFANAAIFIATSVLIGEALSFLRECHQLKFATNRAAILDLPRSSLRTPSPLLLPCKLAKHSLPMHAWMPTPIIWSFYCLGRNRVVRMCSLMTHLRSYTRQPSSSMQ